MFAHSIVSNLHIESGTTIKFGLLLSRQCRTNSYCECRGMINKNMCNKMCSQGKKKQNTNKHENKITGFIVMTFKTCLSILLVLEAELKCETCCFQTSRTYRNIIRLGFTSFSLTAGQNRRMLSEKNAYGKKKAIMLLLTRRYFPQELVETRTELKGEWILDLLLPVVQRHNSKWKWMFLRMLDV